MAVEDVLAGVKVGDKLFLKRGYYDTGRIEIVERVTPKGWVVTKSYTFFPSGLSRGSSWHTASARPAKDSDVANIEHVRRADSMAHRAKKASAQ